MLKFYTIPILNYDPFEQEMNSFISSHRVLKIEKRFSETAEGVFWCICIEYLKGGNANSESRNKANKTNYKEVLTEDQFKKFTELREIRKEIAKEETLPAYAVFTDEELAGISKLEEISLKKIKSVEGIGEKKVERYGQKFLDLLTGGGVERVEENGKPD